MWILREKWPRNASSAELCCWQYTCTIHWRKSHCTIQKGPTLFVNIVWAAIRPWKKGRLSDWRLKQTAWSEQPCVVYGIPVSLLTEFYRKSLLLFIIICFAATSQSQSSTCYLHLAAFRKVCRLRQNQEISPLWNKGLHACQNLFNVLDIIYSCFNVLRTVNRAGSYQGLVKQNVLLPQAKLWFTLYDTFHRIWSEKLGGKWSWMNWEGRKA